MTKRSETRRALTFFLSVILLVSSVLSRAQEGKAIANGLVLPRDGGGMVLRSADGEVEIEWTQDTRVALEVNSRQFRHLKMADKVNGRAREGLSELESDALDRREKVGAEASKVMTAFLEAKTVKERLEFVRDPKRVGPIMEKYYKHQGHGPIEFRKPKNGSWKMTVHKSFLLAMIELADFSRIPLAVERVEGGKFLIDWESFVGHCEIPWDQIKKQRSEKPFLIRARASVSDYFNFGFDDDKWVCVGLTDQEQEQKIYGYVEKESALKDDLQRLIGSKGPTHAVLRVAYPEGGKGDNQLLITEVVSKGWVLPRQEKEKPKGSGIILSYHVPSSSQVVDFELPLGPMTVIVNVRGGKQLAQRLKEAAEENWISQHGLELHFSGEHEEQLPTEEDPRFIGKWDPGSQPNTLSILGKKYELSLKKGGQTNALLFDILGTADCKPFVNRASVIGERKGDVIVAEEIDLMPIGDQAALDVPGLPRYLYIGDSISGNYGKGLRAALAGKFNLHHPPTNCGPSGKGRECVDEWLGAYGQKGRHWDVISFNFGHWDAGNDKASYQANLEAVIAKLKKTGAKLIWVTTCPVPKGMPPAGELTEDGRAPRRSSGVMEKYLNPWAAEVIAKHPEISICDQWKFVSDSQGELYTGWWKGKNVHFSGEAAAALGKLLADHVTDVMGGE